LIWHSQRRPVKSRQVLDFSFADFKCFGAASGSRDPAAFLKRLSAATTFHVTALHDGRMTEGKDEDRGEMIA
jgi:hypothetical protein